MDPTIHKNFRYNFTVNLLDGGFFGMALGFASFVTILPLFVSTMTDSAILIGLIPAIHSVGWQLPQLFLAGRISGLRRYKPMVVFMTIHERLPFLALAVVALAIPKIGKEIALPLTFAILIWQGLGGGFTANAWQVLMAKVITVERLGTFYGFQSAAANLLMSGSAVAAGVLLERLGYPLGYAVCFGLAGITMLVSLGFLASNREPESAPKQLQPVRGAVWASIGTIWKKDRNFRRFLAVRALSYLAVMAFAFYTVFAVREHGMSESTAGLMLGVSTFGQIIANPVMGWIGDRWNHTLVLKMGAIAAALSALIAWWAPSLNWFYLVFILTGVANVSLWTIGLAMTTHFGSEDDRPVYIGMANTLIAPFTIFAPIVGGWLADTQGYPVTFLVSAICGLLALIVLQFSLKDPRREKLENLEYYYGG